MNIPHIRWILNLKNIKVSSKSEIKYFAKFATQLRPIFHLKYVYERDMRRNSIQISLFEAKLSLMFDIVYL